ncbi:NADPH oxidase organizer 1a [Brachyistius frenatus]|uniref:NADPH oxidase organizer 1a n=1 Tax=Brachyistius frenatus TaxID=100188 RepID=UPI0037E888A2
MEVERYPISVRLVGVMHKEKIKMYLTSVLWSDQNDILVYRSLKDFKKMHKQMKNAFPPASKLKKSDRIIPTFQDKKIKPIGRKKGPTKSLVRLKNLQKYCNELLSCDPRVSQSADLIRFFHPSDQDMQPEFAKNSIMVMPSENEIRNDGGNVTQPFVTETYRCVAPYETKDTKNKPFKVAVDENVDVLIKDKAGWWLVEKENKQMAWFPAPYLEKIDDDGDDDDEIDSIPERGMLYSAVKTYKATKDDEINVNIGAVVEVLQKSDNGWWLIRYKGEAGYIPTMYLQPHNYPHIHLTPHHQDRRVSSPLSSLPSNLVQQSKFSRSQGNLLAAAPARWFSPNPPAARTTFSAAPVVTTSPAAKHAPPPTIMVEMDGEEEPRAGSPPEDSEGSFGSDSSDVSFSDDLSSSSASSFLDLSRGANDEQLRLSRTPPPMASNHLSPTSPLEGKLIHSVSDPNLFKMPAAPRVPPRPQTQDILSRCTTITRKNAAREQRPSR